MGKTKIIYYFTFILKVQLAILALLFVVRTLFVIVNIPKDVPFIFSEWLHAMILGLRFDNHMASYVALFPVITSSVLSFFQCVRVTPVTKIFKVYFQLVYSIVLFLSVANIRYFSVFGGHINYEALGYMRFLGTTTGMILEDSGNYPYFAAAIGFVVAGCLLINIITKTHLKTDTVHLTARNLWLNISMIILADALLFIGMRASFQRYVLRVSFASFSNIPFYNKIGNAAVFNIYETRKQIKRNADIPFPVPITEDEALLFVKQELDFNSVDTTKPLNRYTAATTTPIKPNIVLVLMESMTLHNIENEVDGKVLTPFLRNLRDSSYYFEHFYSAGIHTNNGICASMYGFTPNFSKPCMQQPPDLYTGLPYELKKHGYRTITFITGDSKYDNMNSFLLDNNIDEIYSLPDYPKEKIATRFGVRDDYMFEYGIHKLNESNNETPFFAMFLTCSNHSPYSIPDEYANRFDIIDDQAIAYADDAVKYFFLNAKKTPWGKNTIFVLVADHGKPRGKNIYDMVYYYNRIPCYIYSELFKGKMTHMDVIGGQIDIFPTIMGLLGLDYTNNTLGIDLLRGSRRYIHFVSDEHLGCADREFFYCYNIASNKEFLYQIGNGTNLIDSLPKKAQEMKKYALSMMKINNTAIKQRWINP